MAKPRLFISHISTETEIAQALKKHLTRDFLGFLDIFVSSDGSTIRAGSRWLDELSEALEQAKMEFVLCSKESVLRPWVNFEAGAGWVRGIRVIPICHSGMLPNDLPAPLNMLQAIEANRAEGVKMLYEAVALQLEMQAPAVDFDAIAAEIRDIEKKQLAAASGALRILDPRVLCAASPQYAEPAYGFDRDVEILESAFPGRVTVERALSAKRLRELLTTNDFDLIHLVMAVDPDSGELIFHPLDPDTIAPTTGRRDVMAPEGFASLIVESQTRLVVLATCRAILLAVEVSKIATMIGANGDITGEAAAEWGECFYDLLANGYFVYKAFDITRTNSPVPMHLIRHADAAFAASSGD